MAINGILTESEVALFIAAVAEQHNNEIDETDVIDARGDLAEWVAKYGCPVYSDLNDATGITLHQWHKAQAYKGQQRKDIVLAEFADGRVAVYLS